MDRNSGVPEEMIRNVEDETSEMKIEETTNETSESVDEVTEEVKNEVFESAEEKMEQVEESVENIPLQTKVKKHIKAKHFVEKAKKIVQEANGRMEACKLLLEADLKEYEDAKSKLRSDGLDACVSLVKKLGYQTNTDEAEEKSTVVFEPEEVLKPIVIKDISSGKFSGFIYALLGGFATAVALVYLATEKLEMTLDITKVPSEDVMQSILAWFSTTVGIQEDVAIGAGVLGLAVLLVMILIYVTCVSLKARSNLHFAVKQFVEAELYTEKNANCKVETDKVNAHIKDTVDMIKTYEVLLNEQKGKLQRILYIEGEKEKSTEYHDKSFFEIRETKELIRTIRDFMDIPVLDEGKLSAKSVLSLQNAKDHIDKILQRLY